MPAGTNKTIRVWAIDVCHNTNPEKELIFTTGLADNLQPPPSPQRKLPCPTTVAPEICSSRVIVSQWHTQKLDL